MRHALFLALTALVACTEEPPRAELALSIYGEAFIEDGIPADTFVDGWQVTFTRFLVSLGGLTADDQPFDPTDPRFRVYDLVTAAGGVEVGRITSEVAAFEDVGYIIAPSADSIVGNVDSDTVNMMRDGGYSIYVSGSAKRGGETRAFAWGFQTRTTYNNCAATAEPAGGALDATITIHGDHLFYDDLFSETPNVAFDLIAGADKDGNGVVTEAELRMVDIRAEERYQVGDLVDIKDLWSFLAQQTTTVGHFDGEGHCDNVREE